MKTAWRPIRRPMVIDLHMVSLLRTGLLARGRRGKNGVVVARPDTVEHGRLCQMRQAGLIWHGYGLWGLTKAGLAAARALENRFREHGVRTVRAYGRG